MKLWFVTSEALILNLIYRKCVNENATSDLDRDERVVMRVCV